MISDTEYMRVINDVYDLSDYYTKKKVLFCNEAQKTSNIEHLTNRLYNHIKANVDNIDFGTIPQSRGDITKIENYENLVDCIDVIHKMVIEYKEKTDLVDELSTAIENIRRREVIFEKAFATNIDFPIMTYNSTVLSIVSGVSLLIMTCIEYVKNGKDSFELAFDKATYTKTKDHVLFTYVRSFNKICAEGTLDKLMNETIKRNLVKRESACPDGYVNEFISVIAGTVGVAWGIGSIVVSLFKGTSIIYGFLYPIRSFVYYIKYQRVAFADWLDVQADFIQLNAENLKYREDRKGSDQHRDKVKSRQLWVVDKLRKLSNVFAIKDSKARRDQEDEEREDNRRRPYDDDDDDTSGNDDGGLF